MQEAIRKGLSDKDGAAEQRAPQLQRPRDRERGARFVEMQASHPSPRAVVSERSIRLMTTIRCQREGNGWKRVACTPLRLVPTGGRFSVQFAEAAAETRALGAALREQPRFRWTPEQVRPRRRTPSASSGIRSAEASPCAPPQVGRWFGRLLIWGGRAHTGRARRAALLAEAKQRAGLCEAARLSGDADAARARVRGAWDRAVRTNGSLCAAPTPPFPVLTGQVSSLLPY